MKATEDGTQSFSLFSPYKSINTNYLINEAFYPNILFFLRNQGVHEVDLNMDRQVCVIKTAAYRGRTDRQTHGQTQF